MPLTFIQGMRGLEKTPEVSGGEHALDTFPPVRSWSEFYAYSRRMLDGFWAPCIILYCTAGPFAYCKAIEHLFRIQPSLIGTLTLLSTWASFC